MAGYCVKLRRFFCVGGQKPPRHVSSLFVSKKPLGSIALRLLIRALRYALCVFGVSGFCWRCFRVLGFIERGREGDRPLLSNKEWSARRNSNSVGRSCIALLLTLAFRRCRSPLHSSWGFSSEESLKCLPELLLGLAVPLVTRRTTAKTYGIILLTLAHRVASCLCRDGLRHKQKGRTPEEVRPFTL